MTENLRKRVEYVMGAYGPSIVRYFMPGLVWTGPHKKGEKVLYLTFDDGPTPHLTPILLDILGDAGAQATFFLLGRQVDAHPDLAREIVRRKHSIGVHGYAHVDAWKANYAEVEHDLSKSMDAIRSVTGSEPRLYRPPYGRFTVRTRRLAESLGMRLVMWSIMPGDYLPGVGPARVAGRVMNRLTPGSIVVLHDSANPNVRQNTADVVRRIIEGASAGGWSFETLTID